MQTSITKTNNKAISKTLPALQTSGQYTFWLCLVESQVILRTATRIRRQAEKRRAEDRGLSGVVVMKFTDLLDLHLCVCFNVLVDVAMLPLALAHLLLGQTLHLWGWMTAATS